LILDLLIRFIRWLFDKTGAGTLELYAGLLLLVGSTVIGVSSIVHGLPVTAIMILCMAGMLAAWWLARSPLGTYASALTLILFGLLAQALWVGGLGGPLAYGLRLSAAALRQGIGAQVDWSAAISAWQAASAGTAGFIRGLADWIVDILAGRAAAQPIFAYFTWAVALWAASAWAAWSVRRLKRPLTGALPAGVLLAGSLNYTGGNIAPLLSFITAVMFLLALSSWNERERVWQAGQVDIATDLRADVSVAAIGISIIVVTLAGLLAYAPLPRLGAIARQLNLRPAMEERQIAESLGLTRLPGEGDAAIGSRFGPLPRSHLIGSGPELSSQVLFTVKTGDQAPQGVNPMTGEAVPRYYWRSLVYDQYTGSGWVSSPLVKSSYNGGDWVISPEQPASQEIPQNFRIIRQFVQPAGDSSGAALLHAAEILLAADRDFEVSWRTQPTGTLLSSYLESADAYGAGIESMPYNAVSLLPDVGVEQLRQASGEVPAWIQARYLQLPENMPSRVRALAQQLTRDQPSEYDRAKAIETFLRGFPYTLDLPAPPQDRDLADYFLFDLQRGYCDYYATTMVVLARAAGLPARLVIGYASGAYNAQSGSYVVTAADAHSWPEIYFPNIGWVEFEPTAGQPALKRPVTLSRAAQQQLPGSLNPLVPLQPARQAPPLALLAAGLLLAGSLGVIAWLATDRWRLGNNVPGAAIEVIFRRLYRSGRRLGVLGPPGETPSQFASALQSRLRALAASRVGWLIPPVLVEGISTLVGLYNRAVYSPRPPGDPEKEQAIHMWRNMGWRLWLARLGRYPRR
jgi:transglutaminase-like putative cysteine protease